jgi:Zn-finger nucleic acid-binding protein
MREHLYQRSKEVNVDECYNCGGFFLDSGELHELRDTYMSEAEREAYQQKLIAECPEYLSTKGEMEAERERTEAILHFTRFLRLSYWFGKA